MDSVPTFSQLLWPTLLALKATGGSASNDELLEKVTEEMSVPADVASLIHTDNRQTKLSYNLAWAKTYLKKMGAITNSQRGVWSLTEVGETMSVEDTLRVPAEVRRADRSRQSSADANQDPDDGVASEIASWKDELLSTLLGMPPAAFERLSQRLLREAGFIKVQVTGKTGDGGIDGVGVLRVNLLSFITVFQCKRYSGTVGAGAVRDFRGAMVGRGDKGLIITTGTFSAEASKEATRDGAPAIDLIDGDLLCQLLKDLKLGVNTRLVERVEVESDWFANL